MTDLLDRTLAVHAPGFVLTALLVVSVMAATVVILLRRASARSCRGRARLGWGLALAAVAGIGVWTTHFVAILGFRPDAVLAFDLWRTLASAAIGALCIGGPLMAACYLPRPGARAALGALAGLGVGAMHFAGMQAFEGCTVTHDRATSLVALALGAGFFAGALPLIGRGHVHARRRGIAAATLLVLGVCALHFTALAGVSIADFSVEPLGTRGLDETVLSALVAVGTLALCAGAGAALHADSRLTAQRRAAAATEARQDALFLLALRNMSNGLVMVDADGRVAAANPRLLDILGIDEAAAAPGTPLAALVAAMGKTATATGPETDTGAPAGARDPEEVAEFVADHRAWLAAAVPTRAERRFADGRTLSVVCRPMPDGGGAVLTYDDVTEHRAARDAIVHLAYHDPLTGLPNRRGFREEMQARGPRDEGLAVLMLDLDRFKWVNDTLGHTVGDALLAAVADRLRAACRPEDRVFRLGGDELAVIARGGEPAGTRVLAEALAATFAAPFEVEGHSVAMGCSIGFACAPDGERRNLVEKADLALYRAKSLGRGRVESYESGMMERAVARREIEVDLARALATGAFTLHYQPLHALPERRLIGFEALIRWHHPERGLVSPADFVPIAEANGMIGDIGAWVLDEACRQLALWPDELHVAVNASAVQLRSTDFVALVAATLARHGVAPRRLEIELTETAMVEDGKQMSEVLKGLRRLGVRIAMDDFGTGYSSLAHLRDFELDRIKIDRSFVDTHKDDVGSRAVIRAVTSLARDLSIVTVGEGVETEEQLARLVALGCDVAQGYLLGRPLDAAAAGRVIGLHAFAADLDAEENATAASEADRRRA